MKSSLGHHTVSKKEKKNRPILDAAAYNSTNISFIHYCASASVAIGQ